MSATTQQSKDPVLVVLQLTGGNDYLNTVIPYNNGLYKDNRKAVGIGDSDMIHLDQAHAMPNYMAPLKKFWDDDKLAIMHGVGYLDSPRSHFRSMDIWHTCEAEKVGTEGWLGRVVREFDPKKENVVTAVSFGPCLFRAMSVPDVPVACVAGPLEQYRLPADDPRPGTAPEGAGDLLAHVSADRGQRGDGLPRHHRPRRAEGRRYPEGRAGHVQVRRASTRTRRSRRSSAASPRCISPISAPASSTATMAASTRMPARHRCMPVCGLRSPKAWMPS